MNALEDAQSVATRQIRKSGASRRAGALRLDTALAVLLLAACAPTAVAGPPSDVPLDVLARGSDLVVVGTVTTKDGPKVCSKRLPHTLEPVAFRCSIYGATVEQVLLSGSGLPHRDTVTFVARDLPPAPDLQVPRLERGSSYLLLLQKLPDGSGELFLPDYFKHYLPASTDNVEALTRAIAGIRAVPRAGAE